MADAMRSPRMWEFQELGDHLNLKEADRSTLKIRTIGTIDMTPAERKERRKHANRLYQKAKRQARGATPREQCKSRLEPWKAVGMKRSTQGRIKSQGPMSKAIKLPSLAAKPLPAPDMSAVRELGLCD
jgi:hypothetical protein